MLAQPLCLEASLSDPVDPIFRFFFYFITPANRMTVRVYSRKFLSFDLVLFPALLPFADSFTVEFFTGGLLLNRL